MKIILIFTYATIIIMSYKPKEKKQPVINHSSDHSLYKLTNVDAG